MSYETKRKLGSALVSLLLMVGQYVPLFGAFFASPNFAYATATGNLSPVGTGNYNEWSANTGTKVAAVAANDGDATYIGNSDNNDRQSFTFPGAGIPAGSAVNSVTLSIVAKKDQNNAKIKLLAEKGIGSSDRSTGSFQDLTSNYETYTRVMTTNPFTNNVWTLAEVNSWAVNFGIENSAAKKARVTQVYVVVDYSDPIPGGSAIANWPAQWTTPPQCSVDSDNDENPADTDLVGDGANPAVGFSSDANYFYFRERVGGNPNGPGGFSQFAWVVLFQTNIPKYQLLGSVNGVDEKVQLWENTAVGANVDFNPLFNDPAETVVWEGSTSDYARIVNAGGGFYFIDWAIPTSELASRGITANTTKFFATSANANNYNKDHLDCYNAIADLSLVKDDIDDPVNAGAEVSYTITVTNNGPDKAENVVVTDNVPSEIVSPYIVTKSQGNCSDSSWPSPITCELGEIINGGSATVSVTGTVSSSFQGGTITNTATVASDTLDTNTGNNGDSEQTAITALGTIIVEKQTIPDLDPTDFTFTGDASGAIADGEQITVGNLVPGQYTSTEIVSTGWSLSSVSCNDANSVGDLGTRTATFNVEAGETVTCTFTNYKLPTLTIFKDLITDNGGNKTVEDFGLYIDGEFSLWGTSYILGIGDHSFFEIGPAGYAASFSEGCDDANVNLEYGDEKICTITNSDIAPTITLYKEVTNDNGGDAGENDFGLTVGGSSVSSGETVEVASNSPIEINEAGLSGYEFVEIYGDGNCPSVLGGTVILDEGESIECTIVNDDVAPTVTLVKEVINDNGGDAEENDFGLTVGGNPVNSGETIEVDANTPVTLEETGLSGYEFVSISGDEGCPSMLGGTVILGEGENVTCTITNDDIAPTITLNKVVTNDNGGDAGENDFGLMVGGTPVVSGQVFAVDANKAIALDEVGLSGYSFVSISGDEGCPSVLGGTVTLNEGESLSCTITNDDIAPKLTVIKRVINNSTGTKVAGDFTIFITRPGILPDLTFPGNENGTTVTFDSGSYAVGEASTTGYTAFYSVDCSGTIGVGEEKTCTVTNNDQDVLGEETTIDEEGKVLAAELPETGIALLRLALAASALMVGFILRRKAYLLSR